MAVSISLNIKQNSQSIENNTSNVTVEVYAHWTRGSYNAQTAADGYPDARGTVTIDGTAHAFYSKFNTGHTSSGSQLIFTKTLDIAHSAEGEKVLSCLAVYYTGVSSGTVSAAGTLVLSVIPRKSVLHVADGTLGVKQTVTVERKSTLLTHTVTRTCGSDTATLVTKSGKESFDWTPGRTLAAQYPDSTSVPITLTITTYNGDTAIGTSQVHITCAVPESVVPTVLLEVTDTTGGFEKYGAYVQGKSRLRIAVTAAGAQGSEIKTYKVEADGKTYTKASVTTEAISGTGDMPVTATVTDSRGRTATAGTTIRVLPYTAPSIGELSVGRCDEQGNASSSGAYLAVRFRSAVTALNNKNSAVYTVKYKKTSDSYYTTKTLSNYSGNYALSDGVFVFAAETAYSYDVTLTVKDDFASIPKSAVGSSVKKTWSIRKNGKGFGFGKIAEKENTLDMGWDIELNQNDVLRNGAVAYAPIGLVHAYYTASTDEEIEEIILSQIKDTALKNNAQRNIVVYNSGDSTVYGNTKWFMEFGKSSTNAGYIIAKSYTQGRGKLMLRGWTSNNVLGEWISFSPSDFAPGGFGLGELAPKLLSSADDIAESGFYRFPTPVSGNGNVSGLCISYSETYKTVLAFSTYGNGRGYRRVMANGVWNEWEWFDPPMAPGTEYRTAARYNSKVVYRKAIKYTPSGALAGSFTVPHGISGFDAIVECRMNYNKTMLGPYTGGYYTTVEKVDAERIHVFNTNPALGSADTFYFELAYTKTT